MMSLDGTLNNKYCPTEDGTITLTVADGFNIFGTIDININWHPPYDINGNGTYNEDDDNVDGDGGS